MKKLDSLNQWAEEVIDYCTPIAEKENIGYYAFQSSAIQNINKPLDLLIVGINPGGNFKYKDFVDDKNWEFVDGKMTKNRLLKGNPYAGNFDNWGVDFKFLDRVKYFMEEGNCIFMNSLYFNSGMIKEFQNTNNSTDIRSNCYQLTEKVIKILNPKYILVLGTRDNFDMIPNKKNTATILKTKTHCNINQVLKADYFGIPMYGIPHTSKRNFFWKDFQIKATNEILNKELK